MKKLSIDLHFTEAELESLNKIKEVSHRTSVTNTIEAIIKLIIEIIDYLMNRPMRRTISIIYID